MSRKLESHVSRKEPSRLELIACWISDYGKKPPKGISNRLLRLSTAYNNQAGQCGSLIPKDKKRLADIAQGSVQSNRETVKGTAQPANAAPGTRLMRNWKGRTHIVDVCKDHVVYDGKRFRSLTAVARVITGTNWSGPRFFGLTK